METFERDVVSTGTILIVPPQDCAKTKMYCFVSRLQTQARLSYHALLIWQSEQEAGGEHKYCLGWLLKTRDKPLIHGVLFLWKSPGGSCISSIFSPSLSLCSAFFKLCCLLQYGEFKRNTHTYVHNQNCKHFCQTWAFWLFCRDAAHSSHQNGISNHFCLTTSLSLCMSQCSETRLRWQGVYRNRQLYYKPLAPSLIPTFFFPFFFFSQTTTAERTNLLQVSSVAFKYSGTVTGIPSPVIPGWPLLCLSATPTNNAAQWNPPEQQWAASSFKGYWRRSIKQYNGLPVSECEREDLRLLWLSEGTSINHSRIVSPRSRSVRLLPSPYSTGWNAMIALIEGGGEEKKKKQLTAHRLSKGWRADKRTRR